MHTSLREALAALYSRFDADQLVERYSAAAKLVAEEERRRVRQVGDRVPPFNLTHPERGYISSSDLLNKGPLIVSFYRGLWCSYCQRDLLGIEEAFPEIRRVNCSVVAFTRGVTSEIRAALKHTTNISFPIIDDKDGLIAEQFGLRWSVSDVEQVDAEMGIDLISFRGTRPWILPMQARYLIDQDGVIAFANVAFDYDQRTEPAAMLPALSTLAAS
jgi:peroxiredoxin